MGSAACSAAQNAFRSRRGSNARRRPPPLAATAPALAAALNDEGSDAATAALPPSHMFCRLESVVLQIDVETHELLATMQLQPIQESCHRSASRPRTCWATSGSSATCTAARPKRHLLTTGWSALSATWGLAAGDRIVFLRNRHGALKVAVRRSEAAMAALQAQRQARHAQRCSLDVDHVGDSAAMVSASTPFVMPAPRLHTRGLHVKAVLQPGSEVRLTLENRRPRHAPPYVAPWLSLQPLAFCHVALPRPGARCRITLLLLICLLRLRPPFHHLRLCPHYRHRFCQCCSAVTLRPAPPPPSLPPPLSNPAAAAAAPPAAAPVNPPRSGTAGRWGQLGAPPLCASPPLPLSLTPPSPPFFLTTSPPSAAHAFRTWHAKTDAIVWSQAQPAMEYSGSREPVTTATPATAATSRCRQCISGRGEEGAAGGGDGASHALSWPLRIDRLAPLVPLLPDPKAAAHNRPRHPCAAPRVPLGVGCRPPAARPGGRRGRTCLIATLPCTPHARPTMLVALAGGAEVSGGVGWSSRLSLHAAPPLPALQAVAPPGGSNGDLERTVMGGAGGEWQARAAGGAESMDGQDGFPIRATCVALQSCSPLPSRAANRRRIKLRVEGSPVMRTVDLSGIGSFQSLYATCASMFAAASAAARGSPQRVPHDFFFKEARRLGYVARSAFKVRSRAPRARAARHGGHASTSVPRVCKIALEHLPRAKRARTADCMRGGGRNRPHFPAFPLPSAALSPLPRLPRGHPPSADAGAQISAPDPHFAACLPHASAVVTPR
ncbi:unnamed protein product [Closterium sp. NIES-64]|nr:unnamed protein product [Closterium sp. NIES-64]